MRVHLCRTMISVFGGREVEASTPDIRSIIGQVAGGGVAGALVTAIVGAIKHKTA